jgi:hypothetical protein
MRLTGTSLSFYGLYAALAFFWILKFADSRFELRLTPFMPWLAHPWSVSFTPVLSLVYALFLTKLLSIPVEQPKLWRFIRPLMVLLFLMQLLAGVQLFTGPLITSSSLFFALDALPAFLIGILLICCYHPQPQQVETISAGRRNQPLPDCPFSASRLFCKTQRFTSGASHYQLPAVLYGTGLVHRAFLLFAGPGVP